MTPRYLERRREVKPCARARSRLRSRASAEAAPSPECFSSGRASRNGSPDLFLDSSLFGIVDLAGQHAGSTVTTVSAS
jgi:hypothetical protein